MIRAGLKSKLVIGSLIMMVIVMTASAVVVSVIINRQNRHASNGQLRNALNIIREDLGAKQEKLLLDANQAATVNKMGGKVKLLLDFKNTEDSESITQSSYKEITHALSQIGTTGKLWQLAIYDLDGGLISFFLRNEHQDITVGYLTRSPKTTFHFATFKKDEQVVVDKLEKADALPGHNLQPDYTGRIPKEAETAFHQVGNHISLSAFAPIVGNEYDDKTGELVKKQMGFVVGTQRLEKAFVDKMNSLTGMAVNLFTKDGFSSGNLTGYKELQSGTIALHAPQWDLAKQEALLNDADLDSGGYFQGLLPLYGHSELIGVIAALHSKEIAKGNTWQMIKLLSLVYLGCLLLIFPLVLIFSGSLTKPINRIIGSLTETSTRVASAAAQVSSSSAELAEGSSNQAASLEETSSSLEELSSMTTQNADHAKEADQLSKEGLNHLTNANKSMKALIQSMDDISTASGNVANIIKTIDEIAFQTNLLALNAAVEAARAGESGAGFAVVAEEVRNLALRSAEASHNTQELLEEIIRKINGGSGLVNETDNRYREVALSVQDVTKLLEEISAASSEQAHGINQVNTAVSEIDKVTQHNSTSAEESASASRELNAQAGRMEKVIEDLASFVGGIRKDDGAPVDPPVHAEHVTASTPRKVEPLPSGVKSIRKLLSLGKRMKAQHHKDEQES